MKGHGQERPLDFSLKLNMAKTAPNFACQFIYMYMCRKLSCSYFAPFLLRTPEIKYEKTLFGPGLKARVTKGFLFYYLRVFVSDLPFFLARI